jgi:hypothetical protein
LLGLSLGIGVLCIYGTAERADFTTRRMTVSLATRLCGLHSVSALPLATLPAILILGRSGRLDLTIKNCFTARLNRTRNGLTPDKPHAML